MTDMFSMLLDWQLKFFAEKLSYDLHPKDQQNLEILRSAAHLAPLTVAVYEPGKEVEGWVRMDESTKDQNRIDRFTQAFRKKGIPKKNWPQAKWYYDQGSGFRAAGFLREKPNSLRDEEFVLVFCPTYITSLNDWRENLTQVFGGVPSQHCAAKNLAKPFYKVWGKKMQITGTSLGASLGAFAGMSCVEAEKARGPRCVFFNPMPLGEGLLKELGSEKLALQEKFIKSFSVAGDMTSDPWGLAIPKKNGEPCGKGVPIYAEEGARCLGQQYFFPPKYKHFNLWIQWILNHRISSFPTEMIPKGEMEGVLYSQMLMDYREVFGGFADFFSNNSGGPPIFQDVEKKKEDASIRKVPSKLKNPLLRRESRCIKSTPAK